jgi:hypothetical protein
VSVAVEDDVIPVGEHALDLAMCVRTIGAHPGDELAKALHTLLDERIVRAIGASGIGPERVLNVAFKDRLLMEGDCVGLVCFGYGRSLQGGLNRIPRITSDVVGNLPFFCNFGKVDPLARDERRGRGCGAT